MTVVPTQPQSQELTEALIRVRLSKALKDVFRVMLRRQVDLCDQSAQGESALVPTSGTGEALPTHVLGTVGYVGKLNGAFNLYVTEEFATALTRQLLRANEHYTKRTAETAITDAIGEITNMASGVFKNSLAANGFTCRLTTPKVFRCRLGTMEPTFTANRYVYHFNSAESRVVVELLFRA
jgi:CheY-specific phosphatase CheX